MESKKAPPSSGKKKLDRFGKYLLLDHLVDGGMAKICRARYLGEQADKIVAIKMVQPQFSQDESFKTMFMDEIKVTFGLIHPNIVQTYDYGLHNEQLYVAMEYCDGRNLKEYLDKLREKKFVFPVEISVYIITQVCQGLHYAHTLTDKLTGKAANIIHRDISPHNIMLTYDGAVKVIDFGIAKAETNTESTQAGTIKGKLSYLAPEYLEGLELDPRYDLFAVGITLWEMLCSRKLFKASNDLAVLKKIQECRIAPPSTINPNVPKELDEIVLKALARDRDQRFENMDQLNRALIKFLYSTFSDFNASDLSYFAKELFKEEIKKDREKLFEFGKIDLAPYLKDLKLEREGKLDKSGDQSEEENIPAPRSDNILDFGFDEEEEGKGKVSKKRPVISRKSKKKGISLDEEEGEGPDSPPPVSKRGDSGKKTVVKKTKTLKKTTPKEKTGPKIKRGKAKEEKKSLPIGAALFFLLILGGGYYIFKNPPKMLEKIIGKSSKGKSKKSQSEEVKIVGKGTVTLKNFDSSNQRAFINGEQVSVSVLGEIQIPLYKKVTLRVETVGFEHYISPLEITSETGRMSFEIPKTNPAIYAYLFTSSPCFKGTLKFNLFGENRVETSPISGRGIPLALKGLPDGGFGPQSYEITYQPEGRDFVRSVKVTAKKEDDAIDFCRALGL
jgi:serine/threonine protein kinase